MKKIIPFVVIGILVLSGLGAGALNIIHENSNLKATEKISNENIRGTHTVLGEFGTTSTCPYCRYAHGALKELYLEGQLDFYYITYVCNKNSVAQSYCVNHYNIYGVPILWWDGGLDVDIGAGSVPAAKSTYTSSINYCGSQSVKDVDIDLTVTWLGGTNMQVDCSVTNNEPDTYGGTIQVAICEKESSMSWYDSGGVLYTMVFLDWAFKEPISISNGGSWSDSTTWDGASHGYSSITPENTIVIAAAYNDEWHQGYSYQNPDYPFDAYYVDECVGVSPGTNSPPDAPTIAGPTVGDAGVEYDFTFTTEDPENEDIYLWINWGDQSSDEWIGPYDSGEGAIVGHIYDEDGRYEITAKAKDINNIEGGWSDPHEIQIGGSPFAPTITGETTVKKGTAYQYTFNAEDPDGDNIKYYVNWDDGDTSESTFNPSGTDFTISHKWDQEGSYIITAYAEDDKGFIGPEGSLSITVTKTKSQSINFLFQQFLENHLNIFSLIRQLLGL